MCDKCNYKEILIDAHLEATNNRMRILEIIGDNPFPLSVKDICHILERGPVINRVTVYRILDLLVDHGVVDRISTGGRAFYYGMAPNQHHLAHPHFYCKHCGQMDCLSPESVTVDMETLLKTFPGKIDKLEIRVDGTCKNCMKNH